MTVPKTFFQNWEQITSSEEFHNLLSSITTSAPEISKTIFNCTGRNLGLMIDDGRFLRESFRIPKGNREEARRVWFVRTVEYWLGEYCSLEEEHPENRTSDNAKEATRRAVVYDNELKTRLRDGTDARINPT